MSENELWQTYWHLLETGASEKEILKHLGISEQEYEELKKEAHKLLSLKKKAEGTVGS